ncbi:MAG: hypothetical protein K8R58_15510, partial [Bacteroidales bacterium]|nr:hypothetical protein [Bacteroidales bacterium]
MKSNIYNYLIILILFSFCKIANGLEYYWIGGTGNWSNLNHWSKTSGGTILHIQVPTSEDDVYFDENSFTQANQIVTVNLDNAICKNMDWTGANFSPTFSGSGNIRIYGSLKFINNMNQNFNGTVTFESTTTGNNIELSGQQFYNHIYFQGIGGGWSFFDDFTVNGTIQFIHGTLKTNSNKVICNGFCSNQPNNRTLVLGNSEFNISGSWEINGIDLILKADSSFLKITQNLTNDNGDKLFYNNIEFFGGSSNLNNYSVYGFFNFIKFNNGGIINGNCSIDSVIFNGNGKINDSDSIYYIAFNSYGFVNGGKHIINKVIFGGDGQIFGNNSINTALFHKMGIVDNINTIETVIIDSVGIINGENIIGTLLLKRNSVIRGENTIRNASFKCNGDFFGTNTFDTLSFTPGFIYLFEHEKTQTITNEFNTNGICTAPIILQSDFNSIQATIHKINGNVEADYLSIRDINASGTNIPFIANISVDLGNNTNWEIDTSMTTDLFWVDGTGNWNDSLHWAAFSGGNGGYCPPTAIDNVFFDANSFSTSNDTVYINTGNAVCRNMDWTGAGFNPVLTGPDTNNLRIYGSLKFINAMELDFQGITFFEATSPDKTITTAQNKFNNHVYYQGRNGGWTLLDAFNTAKTIYLIHGILNTDGNNVDCNRFDSYYTNFRELYLNTSTITVNQYDTYAWYINGTNFTLDADSSLIISIGIVGNIISDNADRLIYNNIEFYGAGSELVNNAYCVYNLVTYYNNIGVIKGNCTIDTAVFWGANGLINNSDSIKTIIFYGDNGIINGGNHIIEIAYFYNNGYIYGNNKIDTALFYTKG